MISMTIDMDVFNKRHDKIEPGFSFKTSPARKMLEHTTGICLGRSSWSGNAKMILTNEQFGLLVAHARSVPPLHKAVSEATIYIMNGSSLETVFYGKGLER